MKRYLLSLAFFFSIVMAPLTPVRAANTDIWNLSGQGIYNGKDMVHVDNQYNLRIYNGDIYLGDNAIIPGTANVSTTPSITSGGYYSLKVPFYNGGPSSTAEGTVIVSSITFVNTSSNTYEGSYVAALATTTVIGVSEGVVASGSIGYMSIGGYALVLTTGAVKIGDILVTTGTAAGYAGATTGTQVVGTMIGKALTPGTAAGGTVLALITLQ